MVAYLPADEWTEWSAGLSAESESEQRSITSALVCVE